MKKSTLLVVTLLIVLFIAMPAHAGGGIMVTIDGEEMAISPGQGYPTIVGGRTLVPLRAIFEALGAKVDYEASVRSIKATKGKRLINLTVDNQWANVQANQNGGNSVKLDVPPTLINGRTYVPLRFVSEALGCKVGYETNGANAYITITTKNNTVVETPDNNTVVETSEFTIKKDGVQLDGIKSYGGLIEREENLTITNGNGMDVPHVLAADSDNKPVKVPRDGVYEADFKFDKLQGNGGITFNVLSPRFGDNQFKGYTAGLDPVYNIVYVGKSNYNWQEIKQVKLPFAIKHGTYYNLKVAIWGGRIDVYVNDKKYISLYDNEHSGGGYFGPRLYGTTMTYKNVGYSKDLGNLRPDYFTISNADGQELKDLRIFGQYDLGETLTLLDSGKKKGPMALPLKNGYIEVFPSSGIYEAKFKFKQYTDGNAGFVFNVSNPKPGNDQYKGYYVGINLEKNTVQLGKANYNWTNIKEQQIPLFGTESYILKVKKIGQSMTVYVNGKEIFTAKDGTYNNDGYFGARVWNTDAEYEFLKAAKLPF